MSWSSTSVSASVRRCSARSKTPLPLASSKEPSCESTRIKAGKRQSAPCGCLKDLHTKVLRGLLVVLDVQAGEQGAI